MTAEYARLKGETNHNVLPNVGRSLPDQAFDARLQENLGSPYEPEQNHFYSSKLGPRIGRRTHRVPP
jgi:hypothetical protein